MVIITTIFIALKHREITYLQAIRRKHGYKTRDLQYVSNNGGVYNEVIAALKELGIEVKTGHVYPMPENPDTPSKDDFTDNQTGYEQALKDFQSKQTKWNALQSLIENGIARKVILLENLFPEYGYIMVDQQNQIDSAEHDQKNQNGHKNNLPVTVENVQTSSKPDLMTTLSIKDQKNREEALCNVIEDAKKLVSEADIPPAEITPFEEALMFYVMLADLNIQHYDLFGIPEGQEISEDDKFRLYNSLSDIQKNVLKRDFLVKNITQVSGICKTSALLVELCKYYFPDEIAEIENTQNEEYLKKKEAIQNQMVKIKSKKGQILEVA